MPHSGLVVRLTHCENVPGFPALLAAALSNQGCPWYPEYVVYEEYHPYGQGHFYCEVQVYNETGNAVQYLSQGVGITIEQSVQEAAYNGLANYRYDCPYLAVPESCFYYFTAATPSREGGFLGLYQDPSVVTDLRYRTLVDLTHALDRRARQLYLYFIASRMSHWDTLMSLESYIADRVLPEVMPPPSSVELPHYMLSLIHISEP